MKKCMAFMLAMVLMAVGILAGCSGRVVSNGGTTEEKQDENQDTAKTEGLKTGLAMSVSLSGSTDAGEEDGLAQADVTVAAVTVDADGKVVACAIDAVQGKVNFNKEGKITTDLAQEFQTKQELGDAYGMKAASSIQKEWYEQADGFAAYCVGKTAEEITAIPEGDADLTAACTMHPGNFQWLVAKAMGNATDSGAQATDKLGVGIVTSISQSADAGEEDGLAQSYVTAAAVTTDASGKITSAAIDAVQANVNFDTAGKIKTDLSAEVATKNELGDAYGMKAASSIGKEWNEQAAAYAAYAVGKTVDEVNGTAVDAGVPTDADLAASVTVHITDFNTVITKAVK